MIARINYPGSQHHRWFRGSKKSCVAWLHEQEDRLRRLHDGAWYSVYGDSSDRLLTEKVATRLRYHDGSRIYPKNIEGSV